MWPLHVFLELWYFMCLSTQSCMRERRRVVALPAGRWDEIKKAQPQVKTDVEPIQANEAERIRNDLVAFGTKVGRVGGGVRAHVCVCVCRACTQGKAVRCFICVCVCACAHMCVC